MKRALVLAIICAAHVAGADPHHILVLHSDGTADAATRAKIDTQVLKLARSQNLEGANVEAGEISFSDAATAAGCTPTEASCKDDVLATLGVDEIVVTTANTGPGGEVKVTVERYTKGKPAREATSTIPAGQAPDVMMNDDIGPMFGLVRAAKPAPTPEPEPTPTPAPAPAPAPAPTAAPAPAPAATVTAAPNGQVETTSEGSHRLEVTGLAVGGALVAAGVVFWIEASSTQDSINSAPTKSPKDFANLQDLESQGDLYAALGNASFIAGLAVAAASGYFYLHDRHAEHAQHARLAPTVFPHGAGVALTFGGGR